MKKTIKRGLAVLMYNNLSALSFGHLDDKTLEAVMTNMSELEKVTESHNKLMQELGKRLYDGVGEAEAKKYNELVESGASNEELIAKYPTVFERAEKQRKVEISLQNKDVEIELEKVDRNAFIKAVLKGKPSVAYGLFALFTPMFEDEKKEDKAEDFSELDELMK